MNNDDFIEVSIGWNKICQPLDLDVPWEVRLPPIDEPGIRESMIQAGIGGRNDERDSQSAAGN